MKYYVHKYNLTFCYQSQQHGKGIFAYKILPLTIFTIMFAQVLNATILVGKMSSNSKPFITLGIAIIVIELVVILVYKLYKVFLRYS